ncbi:hypothetical protein DSECCO2_625900 [anaerobic digester metagenome]
MTLPTPTVWVPAKTSGMITLLAEAVTRPVSAPSRRIAAPVTFAVTTMLPFSGEPDVVTVTTAEPVTVLFVAFTRAVPGARAVKRPLSIRPTVSFEQSQATVTGISTPYWS